MAVAAYGEVRNSMMYMINKNCTDLFTRTLVKNGTMVVSYEDEYGAGERGRQVYRICELEDGSKIKTAPCNVEPFIVGDGEVEDYSVRRYFWKPEMRLIIDYDTEDLSSGMMIKQDTIVDDWMDNEDGTYEISLDGVTKQRIMKKDVTKIY